MNKADLIDVVSERIGGTKSIAESAVVTVLETITDKLKSGEEVSIAGFGIFLVKDRAARTARNPKTGEPVQVPATRVPKFKPAMTNQMLLDRDIFEYWTHAAAFLPIAD